jgi:serine/threonine-protein kinase
VSADERQVGRVLAGKYRLVELLGKGGMGTVWRAEHLTLDATVAIKLLKPEIAADSILRKRFLREAKAAAQLRSPHVVQILDHGEDDGTAFICMELLHGESLRARLGREGRLTPTETALVVRHVARAIQRAHDAGIVHRDLKPDNVFLIDNDGDLLAKVLDFGIVKTTQQPSHPEGFETASGVVVGTPCYMSPEQMAGAAEVDHRTDIWALGVIAFECLCGQRPFHGGSLTEIAVRISLEPIPLPSSLATVPRGFDEWFQHATSRDRESRFDSAKCMADELDAVIEGRPNEHALAETERFPDADGSPTSASPVPDATTVARLVDQPVDQPTVTTNAAIAAPYTDTKIAQTALKADDNRGKRRRPAVGWLFALSPFLALVIVASVWIALAVWQVRSSRETASSASATISAPVASAAPAPTPVTSQALPASTSHEALAAYRRGLEAFRGSRWSDARERFEEALKVDPNMAAAQLRVAIAHVFGSGSGDAARQAFSEVASRDNLLSPRDRALVKALRAMVLDANPSAANTAKAIAVVRQQYPGDAELANLHSVTCMLARDARCQLEAAEAALRLDPDYLDAWQVKASALASLGRHAEASATLDACLERSPTAMDCRLDCAKTRLFQGDCQLALDDAKAAVMAGDRRGHMMQALALTGLGAARETIEDELGRAVKSAHGSRGKDGLLAHLDMLDGNFARAIDRLEKLKQATDGDMDSEWRDRITLTLLTVYAETDSLPAAVALAEQHLRHSSAAIPTMLADLSAIAMPMSLATLHRAGKLDDAAFAAALDRWRTSSSPRIDPSTLWLTGTVWIAATPLEARKALAAKPADFSLGSVEFFFTGGRLGIAYLLAGETDQALPLLETGGRQCAALQNPVQYLRINDALGRALEAKGRKREACDAYRRVLARSDRDVPRSLTRERSRKAAAALGCKGSP